MGASGSQVSREGQAEGEGKRKGGRESRKRKQEFLKMRRKGQEAGAGQNDLPRPPHTQGSCFGDLEGRERWSGRPVTFLVAAGKYLDCRSPRPWGGFPEGWWFPPSLLGETRRRRRKQCFLQVSSGPQGRLSSPVSCCLADCSLGGAQRGLGWRRGQMTLGICPGGLPGTPPPSTNHGPPSALTTAPQPCRVPPAVGGSSES